MYLSHLLIDMGNNPDRPRPGRLWLRNLYHVHQRLCMAFPSDLKKQHDPDFLAPYTPDDFSAHRHLTNKKNAEIDYHFLNHVHMKRNPAFGFLFRIDAHSNGRAVILVQSATNPDWEYAFHNADFLLAAPPDVKSFDFDFKKGQKLRFRLIANPTRRLSKKSPDGKKESIGKRVPVRNEQLLHWLTSRAEKLGFAINIGTVIIQQGYIYMNKTPNRDGQRLRSVRYEGILEITDVSNFQNALISGIGPAKAFGFGLLSIAPVKP